MISSSTRSANAEKSRSISMRSSRLSARSDSGSMLPSRYSRMAVSSDCFAAMGRYLVSLGLSPVHALLDTFIQAVIKPHAYPAGLGSQITQPAMAFRQALTDHDLLPALETEILDNEVAFTLRQIIHAFFHALFFALFEVPVLLLGSVEFFRGQFLQRGFSNIFQPDIPRHAMAVGHGIEILVRLLGYLSRYPVQGLIGQILGIGTAFPDELFDHLRSDFQVPVGRFVVIRREPAQKSAEFFSREWALGGCRLGGHCGHNITAISVIQYRSHYL